MGDMQTYGYGDIERYLRQKMTPQEMHAFEKALMDDPFLADALEGFSTSDVELAGKHLYEIESELKGEKQKGKVVAMPLQKRSWWKVAAVILLVATGGVLSYSLLTKKGAEKNIAQQKTPLQATEMATKKDSVGPAEKPLAKVEVLPNKEPFNKNRTASPIIIREEEQAPMAAMKPSRLKADTTGVLMMDKSTGSAAFMDTSMAATATLTPSKNYDTEEPAIESKKSSMPPALAKNQFKARAADTNTKAAKPQVSASSYSERKKISNIKHLTEKKANGAEPIGGWKNFEQYLNWQIDSLKVADINSLNAKNVRIEFLIDEDSQPVDIKVMDNQSSLTTEMAVQILKNGPKWKKKKDKKVSLTITF